MKKTLIYATLLCAMVGFVACTPAVSFDEDLLIGKWEDDNSDGLYYVYLTETDETGSYQYGKTWDEKDDVTEEDLQYHGNGWFKWQLVQSDLTQIHLMDNGGAEIPKIYTITYLDDNTLQYKDEFNQYSFHKVR